MNASFPLKKKREKVLSERKGLGMKAKILSLEHERHTLQTIHWKSIL